MTGTQLVLRIDTPQLDHHSRARVILTPRASNGAPLECFSGHSLSSPSFACCSPARQTCERLRQLLDYRRLLFSSFSRTGVCRVPRPARPTAYVTGTYGPLSRLSHSARPLSSVAPRCLLSIHACVHMRARLKLGCTTMLRYHPDLFPAGRVPP
ncbi:hypothetical protein C8Q78DRAFT_1144581 [Trametes maxima]|nr:hypothetical protein C8Q78DRAFT_1144581 [Trametes maxima]